MLCVPTCRWPPRPASSRASRGGGRAASTTPPGRRCGISAFVHHCVHDCSLRPPLPSCTRTTTLAAEAAPVVVAGADGGAAGRGSHTVRQPPRRRHWPTPKLAILVQVLRRHLLFSRALTAVPLGAVEGVPPHRLDDQAVAVVAAKALQSRPWHTCVLLPQPSAKCRRTTQLRVPLVACEAYHLMQSYAATPCAMQILVFQGQQEPQTSLYDQNDVGWTARCTCGCWRR